jgi:hypothetical protein
MPNSISILCVHGVGHGDVDPELVPSWTGAITRAIQRWNPNLTPTLDFLDYDKLFEDAPHNPLTYAEAFARLLASGVTQAIGGLFRRERGLLDLPKQARWTAGMVAQWVSDEALRRKSRDRLLAAMHARPYDAVFAHSLGSLVCYDTFRRNPAAIGGKVFASFGSQIGNACLRDAFAGRIEPLDAARWYHLFNRHDHVFTAPLNIHDERFVQLLTPFDKPSDIINHDPAWYLGHEVAGAVLWRALAGARDTTAMTAGARTFRQLAATPQRRALLVGINEYPNAADRLEGCVNDVYLMSATLQESGFQPEEIRVVLDDRATAEGILERLHWLLDEVEEGGERVLFYSGHGAQMPAYGIRDEPDHLSECLVPYDFDWTPQRAILDKQFKEFYSQLPYGSHFVAVFDCCHAGGMHRDGARRVRGLSPPDDIRHRMLKWNPELRMWQEREFKPPNATLAASGDREAYLGASGCCHRIGRGVELRTLPNRQYDKTRAELGHHGPYQPVIFEACREAQLSYEYRHGVTSYGAFTYTLVETLRASRQRGRNLTFEQACRTTGERLAKLGYAQTPALLGPKSVLSRPIPWSRATQPARRRGKTGGRRPRR